MKNQPNIQTPIPLEQGGTAGTDATTARANLNVPSNADLTNGLAAKQDVSEKGQAGGYAGLDGTSEAVPLAQGGTNATDAAGARANLDVPSNAELISGLAGKQDRDQTLDEISGLTMAKGDLFVHNGTSVLNLGAGSDGQVLQANSAASAGVEWGGVSGIWGQWSRTSSPQTVSDGAITFQSSSVGGGMTAISSYQLEVPEDGVYLIMGSFSWWFYSGSTSVPYIYPTKNGGWMATGSIEVQVDSNHAKGQWSTHGIFSLQAGDRMGFHWDGNGVTVRFERATFNLLKIG